MIDISVAVPTFRRPTLLRRCLESLAAQDLDHTRFEIIVVDDGSGDETDQVLADARKRVAPLRSFTHPGNLGPAAARNRAVTEARGDLILFLDDDVVATPALVGTHLRIHRSSHDEMLGVLGLMRWDPGLRVTSFMRWLDRSGLQFGYDTWIREGAIEPPYAAFYTCNLSLPRRVVADAGGFDERFPYPAYEDMELAWRLAKAGFHLEHHPNALAYHARPIDLRSFAARMTKVGESAVLLKAVQPEIVIDEPDLGPVVRRRERVALRIVAPVARLIGARRTLERHYRAEITAAYAAGRERGTRRVTALGLAGPRASP